MMRTPSPCCPVLLLAVSAFAQAPREAEPLIVTPVKTSLASDAASVSIVVEHGRIARIVPASDPLPPATRVIDGQNRLAVPAFVDAACWSACVTPEPRIDQDLPADLQADVQIDMREANRKGIQPAFRAAAALDFTPEERKSWRESGFAVALAAPHGEILAGTSALVVTRDAAPRDLVLAPDVFAHAAFAAQGPGYPSTLMGYTAQLRQLFLDAAHEDELAARALAGRPGPRPAFDAELAALAPVRRRERRVACEAELASDVDRWLALGAELGFDVAIVGGSGAFERADVLAAKRVPVILTLQWGTEPDDPDAKPAEPPSEGAAQAKAADDPKRFEYEEPLGVRRAKRARWTERRDAAKVLAEKGVRIAFGSANDGANELLAKVRAMVEAGLPRDVALRALTSGAAEIVGAARLGRLEPGADADFALWTADPLQKDAHVAWLVVDGVAHEFDVAEAAAFDAPPEQGVDATGKWLLTFRAGEAPPETLELEMKPDGAVAGELSAINELTHAPISAKPTGRVSKKRLRLTTKIDLGAFAVDVTYDGELAGDAWNGKATVKGPFGVKEFEFEGRRQPK